MTQNHTDPNFIEPHAIDPATGNAAVGSEQGHSEQARLADEVERLSAEVEQLKAQTLLERADLENQRKRLSREVETARRFANERLLSGLVPVFDALEAGLLQVARGRGMTWQAIAFGLGLGGAQAARQRYERLTVRTGTGD